MIAIQDVPIAGETYLCATFTRGEERIRLAIELEKTASASADAFRSKAAQMKRHGWIAIFSERDFLVLRTAKRPTKEEIAASIRRASPRRTLLAVANDTAMKDALNPADYWEIDWRRTRLVLEELNK